MIDALRTSTCITNLHVGMTSDLCDEPGAQPLALKVGMDTNGLNVEEALLAVFLSR